MDLQIEYLPIGSIKPYKGNANKHNEKSIAAIKASITDFGMCDPLGIWGSDNLIVEGHGRLEALKELGYATAPVIRLDHLTDEQRRAYTLAHNKTAEFSTWDMEMLDIELDDIFDIDMSEFGVLNSKISLSEEFTESFSLPNGDKKPIVQMTFTLHDEQAKLIRYAMDCVKDEIQETFGNTNKHGNELYEVVRQWAERRK